MRAVTRHGALVTAFLALCVAAMGRTLVAQGSAGSPDSSAARPDPVRDSVVAVAARYFERLERRDWRAASVLLDPRVVVALRDAVAAALSHDVAYPPPPVPTVDEQLTREPQLTRAAAERLVEQMRGMRGGFNYRMLPPFLLAAGADSLARFSTEELAVRVLMGSDPRMRHEALNRLRVCPPGESVRPEPWGPVRVLGGVRVTDSLFYVAWQEGGTPSRPIPAVMGVQAMPAETPPPPSTLLVVRTASGWRVRAFPLLWSDNLPPDCAPTRR